MTRVMTRIATTTLFWLTALLCVTVALFSARFLLPQPFMTQGMAPHIEARPLIFLTHVASALTALALGPFQLITRRGPRRVWHRWSGRTYVAACLTAAVSGFGLAVSSLSGPISGLGFGLLAIAWFMTTAMGWRKAVQGQFGQHRRWMIRSLSLTFAAVTLRLMLPIVPLTGLDFTDAYRAISFLCWVPNLLLAELWLRTCGWDAIPAAPRRT
ncbi:DUF2306 domain-containing protein [Brevundimonas sp.]|uniref:DUF2306 domain-containing protein n=1 Tax=Brevundimonas sp. TaxID=1871086 RepID=UPI002D287657|nr:DUF2306 domain-containing protein [Brevundimonas sp.]HYC73656.1 DUF2306 domain-containing protein [Brevundimonas sp.]